MPFGYKTLPVYVRPWVQSQVLHTRIHRKYENEMIQEKWQKALQQLVSLFIYSK